MKSIRGSNVIFWTNCAFPLIIFIFLFYRIFFIKSSIMENIQSKCLRTHQVWIHPPVVRTSTLIHDSPLPPTCDEDVLRTTWRRLEDVFGLCLQKTSSRRLEAVLIKMNIFVLVVRLQEKPSRRLQDVLVKANIFVLLIHLQDVFKMYAYSWLPPSPYI